MITDLKKASVKSKVEAVLFSTGHRISLDEISKLCRSRKEDVIKALQELKNEYDEKQSSLMLIEEGDYWKFTVRDHFISIVRKIVTETELTKSVLETLAVIAFKYPILQSDLIKIRTNKAYEHLNELSASGYISRQKHGRTNLIKLTDKFFKYFDLTEEKLKDKFKDFESLAKAIKEKEEEVERVKAEQLKKAEELKKQDERIKEEIEALDESDEEFEVPLETYQVESIKSVTQQSANEEILSGEKEKTVELEVVSLEKENIDKEKEIQLNESTESQDILQPEIKPAEEQIQTQPKEEIQNKEEVKQKVEQTEIKSKRRRKHRERKGIKLTPEMEAVVEQKVNELLGIQQEDKEEKK